MRKNNKNIFILFLALIAFCSMAVGVAAQETPELPLDLPAELLRMQESLPNVSAGSAGPSGPSVSKVEGRKGSRQGSFILDVLDLKNMDIMDVIKLISQKSGLNIVAGQNVKGRVTVFLKRVEVLEALRIIVEAYGWAYVKEDEVIKVMTAKDYEAKYSYKFGQKTETRIKHLMYVSPVDLVPILTQMKSASGKVISDEKTSTLILIDEEFRLDKMEAIVGRLDAPVETKVFHLGYATAEGISNQITEVLTPGLGKMKFDERSNKVVVTDSPKKIKEISNIIDAFDEQDKEVFIEAKIVQVTLDDEHKLGIDWNYIIPHGLKEVELTNDFDILSDSEKRGRVNVGRVGNDQYSVIIEALETVGYVDILSSPKIATVSGKEAKILVGSTEPYVTSTTTTPSSGPTTTAETVNFIEVGVKLFVTPTIHKDGFITMKIKPEVSSVVSTLQTGNNNTIPVVGTSEAETTILIKDGTTIVIGGLIEEEKRSTVQRVPFLGSIPFIGRAFSNENKSTEKTEIIIFLTPKIFTGDLSDETIETGLL